MKGADTGGVPGRLQGEPVDFLLELLDTPAPSGYEQPAAEAFARYAEGFSEVTGDAIGTRYATVNGGGGPRVSLVGHLDEIGFIVTRFERGGLLRFAEVGGWDPTVAVGQRVRVLTKDGPRAGTIGRLATHQMERDEENKADIRDLWIDLGFADEDEARAAVRPGDPIVLDARPHLYANGRLMSRSLDDRIGAFIALEVARRCAGSAQAEVTAIGSVREETSTAGALPAAVRARPDEAVVIDVTFTSDVPGQHEEDVQIDKGPVIVFGAGTRSRIGSQLVKVAAEHDIPVQLIAAGRATYTDADEVVMAGDGMPVGVVCVPTRYLHSPGELLSLRDVELTIELLVHWVRGLAA